MPLHSGTGGVRTMTERIFHAAQVRPGDRVLLTCADDAWPAEQRVQIMDGLQQRFPGVTFTLVNGVTGIAVVPKELADGDDDG